MSVFEAGALASAICTAMATRGGAARAASDPAAFPAATTGSAATWDEAATAVSVPVNIEFAPVFEPVRTAPTALSQGVSSTRPAGSIAPMAARVPVVVMIQPRSMNADVPAPMGLQDRAAEADTRRRSSTATGAMRQAAASQNGGEAMISVTGDGRAECRARASSRPTVSTPYGRTGEPSRRVDAEERLPENEPAATK